MNKWKRFFIAVSVLFASCLLGHWFSDHVLEGYEWLFGCWGGMAYIKLYPWDKKPAAPDAGGPAPDKEEA